LPEGLVLKKRKAGGGYALFTIIGYFIAIMKGEQMYYLGRRNFVKGLINKIMKLLTFLDQIE